MAIAERIRASIALRSIEGIGEVLFRRLVERFGDARAVLRASPAELTAAGLRAETTRAIVHFCDWTEVDRLLDRVQRASASAVDLTDPGYPAMLRFVHDPPSVLFLRGSFVPWDAIAVAVVGSRNASPYGLAVAERFGRELAAAGVTVVSGLAVGIDAAAHRGALRAGGRTIAVLGTGIDRVYPSRHRRLADEIERNGALLTEFLPGTMPLAENFPRRNRIVSGLALAVVVVEAAAKSGSLITARLAADQGREVFAVPGEVGVPRTRGTHGLLRQGAALAEGAADVLEGAMPWLLEKAGENLQTGRSSAGLPPDRMKMLDGLESNAMHVDRIIERSGLDASRALETLLDLELRGLVRQHPGMFFSRVP